MGQVETPADTRLRVDVAAKEEDITYLHYPGQSSEVATPEPMAHLVQGLDTPSGVPDV
jgi:hypothetical protein